jgi:plastocyanin
MRRMRFARVAVILMALALLGAACGGGDGTTDGQQGGANRLVMRDNVFEPTTLTIASGAQLELVNEGVAIHNLTIEGNDVDTDVNAGETQTVSVDVPAGEYEMVCSFHVAEGMTGTITVTE